jgi:ParB-like chromosome segregation protein Spo0J
VLHGEKEGVRALKEEEDLARDLLASLDGEQKEIAVVSAEAPSDILTRNLPTARGSLEGQPDGLAGEDMSGAQRTLLKELIELYVRRLPDAIADDELAKVESVDPGAIRFAWSGSEDRGKGHYYRVMGTTFLAEYDCTQNDANHIHSVWRNLENDFGEDILRQHYSEAH